MISGSAETKTDSSPLQIEIFPNPNKGTFNIHFSKATDKFDMEIFNEIGDVVLKEKYQGPEARSVNISNYPKGIYFLKIKTDEKVFIKKIIKQ